MLLKIKKIIIWPRDINKEKREIEFDLSKVNVITGDSGKGKSAIISIIDYCLGSGKIKIPTGIIREKASWYGVLFEFEKSELLLCRKISNLNNSISNEMFKLEGINLDIPNFLESNYIANDIKSFLNAKAKIIDVGLNDDNSAINSFDSQRPSIRNVISLNFQPQYIVANPSTLFYKADVTVDREKLRIIFPYLLGAIDNTMLEVKELVKIKKRELSFLEKEFSEYKSISDRLRMELQNFYVLGREFGLIKSSNPDPSLFTLQELLDFLKESQKLYYENKIPFIEIGATNEVTNKISTLKDREYDFSSRIFKLRNRLVLLKNLLKSNVEYSQGLVQQGYRTIGSGWFEKLLLESNSCPLCNSENYSARKYNDNILEIRKDLKELHDKTIDSISIYQSELSKTQEQLFFYEREINSVRQELLTLQQEDENFNKSQQTINDIYRFLGRIDQVIENLSYLDNNESLVEKIESLKEEIGKLEEKIDNVIIKQKEKFALDKIRGFITFYAKMFEAEKIDANISLDIEHLTLEFSSSQGNSDYLWEIGSGHNFMAYHISTLLGIHEFLSTLKDSKVPSFIIFDQPSQVYFPEIKNDKEFSDDDLTRLKRIFRVISEFNSRTKGKVQVIILEHAGEDAWKEFDNVKKIKRWREGEMDNALIPNDWA